MTPDEIRARLTAQLARSQPGGLLPCPHCRGSGLKRVSAKVSTQAEVARVIGVSRAQVANFVTRKTDLSFPVGLRLIEWLEEKEKT